MSAFVIVHGAWGGGWEWAGVARELRRMGHEVFTPTLTGLGDRAHLGRDQVVDIGVHVADLERTFEFEELDQVVLCAASYGGMPVTALAASVPDRLRLVVYIDALLPEDGQSALDLLPSGFGDEVRTGLAEFGAAWRIPIPDALREALVPAGSLPDDVRTSYLGRLVPHPAAAFATPVTVGAAGNDVPRAFVRCVSAEFSEAVGGDPIEAGALKARARGWSYREIATPHDPQLYDPVGTARLLAELAQ